MENGSVRFLTLQRMIVAMLVALVIPGSSRVEAQSTNDLIGRWYGESAQPGIEEGKQYDFRRWVADQRADGTVRNLHRYYLGGRKVSETIEELDWGIDKKVYWERCKSAVTNGASRDCTYTGRYEIKHLNAREFIYRSQRSGNEYRMIKVKTEFQLP